MKLNAASELIHFNPHFSNIHPFVPIDQEGYQIILKQLEKDLCACTGFDAISLQPNSGAQGEYTGSACNQGLSSICGDFNRNKMIIPSSAHGTNPASAVMAGFEVVVTGCDDNGNIDIDELRKVATELKETLGNHNLSINPWSL